MYSIGTKKNKLKQLYSFTQILSNDILNNTIEIDNDRIIRVSNIIISLTTIPSRFISDEFLLVLDSLENQILKPKCIYIHLCHDYKRKFIYDIKQIHNRIDYIKKTYNCITINFSLDYGPITKILGLMNVKCHPEDKIIILDDDWMMDNNLTLYYELCYELYNCEGIAINERDIIDWTIGMETPLNVGSLFNDNYQNFVYGWLSYSIKYKYIKGLYDFYTNIILNDDKIIFHDDLIVTLYIKNINLYICGINILFNSKQRLSIDYKDALRDTNANSSFTFRCELEKTYLAKYNYTYSFKKYHLYIDNKKTYTQKLTMQSLDKRWLLFPVVNIKCNCDNAYITLISINSNTFILTIAWVKEITQNIEFTLDNTNIKLKLNTNDWSLKQSFLIYTNTNVLNEDTSNDINKIYPFIQAFDTNITRDIFYIISHNLAMLPMYKYLIFDINESNKFIKNNYPLQILICYNSLINKVYKQELMTLLYIYKYGGLYVSNNFILLEDISNYIEDELYIKNTNNIVFSKEKLPFIQKLIISLLVKTINQVYNDNTIWEIINQYPNFKLEYFNKQVKIEDNIISIDNKLEQQIVLLSEIGFNQIPIQYDKLNGISHIAWINLKRSKPRYNHMMSLFSQISINHSNIEAFDGREIDLHSKMPTLDNTHMTSYELATTLSHIKAISALSQVEGDYFIVCEDDISLYNMFLFNNSLKDIIKNAPSFDILQIQKICVFMEFDNIYNKLTDITETTDKKFVSGTGAYVISKEGIKNFMSNVARFEQNNLIIVNKNLNVADYYIYKYVNTYVYKYNFITTIDKESTIHGDHLSSHRYSSEYELGLIVKTHVV
jgi:GR25 family glycosyltransferase involved in LPS biosynthesis